MTPKEMLQAELKNLSEEDMNNLLRVIREMYSQQQPPAKKPGILQHSMEIQIDASEDFAANLDEYMYGGKKFGGEADVS